MRATTLVGFSICVLAVLILGPAVTNGQQGKKGGGGGGGFDAGAIFDRMAKDRPSIPISEVKFGRDQLVQYAADKGITNGMITRQQYIEFSDQLRAKMTAGGGAPGGGKGGGGPGGKGRMPGGDGGPVPIGPVAGSAPPNPDYMKELADKEFLRKDRNGDGKLNAEEMPDSLRADLAKWDKNGDGLIDIYEFRAYFIDRLNDGAAGQGGKGGGGIASIIIEEEDLDRKPVVYRAGGKMPSGLPAWFKELQVEGQVPLYAWRKAGKDLEEFRTWDMNDDGFITPEEAMKQQAVIAKADPTKAVASGGAPGNPYKMFGGGGQDGGGYKGKDGGGKKGNGDFRKKGGGG